MVSLKQLFLFTLVTVSGFVVTQAAKSSHHSNSHHSDTERTTDHTNDNDTPSPKKKAIFTKVARIAWTATKLTASGFALYHAFCCKTGSFTKIPDTLGKLPYAVQASYNNTQCLTFGTRISPLKNLCNNFNRDDLFTMSSALTAAIVLCNTLKPLV